GPRPDRPRRAGPSRPGEIFGATKPIGRPARTSRRRSSNPSPSRGRSVFRREIGDGTCENVFTRREHGPGYASSRIGRAEAMTDAFTNDELDLLDRIVAESIEPIDPPAAVRARVIEPARRTRQLDESLPGEHESRTVRAEEGNWRSCAPGVRTKKLSKDPAR